MKVYVDELPKNCERCPFHDTKYGICDISGSRVEYFGCHSLTPLSDYTKQVRKEVVAKIKKHIDTQLDFYNTELDEDDDNYAVGYVGGLKWVKDVLELMEGEIK